MTSTRRIGSPDAKSRKLLLNAAEQLMLEEGYAAVSSRNVARKAGLKYQLVWYYFRSMDELFLAVFQRRAEEGLKRQAAILASEDPLRELWQFDLDAASSGALTIEFAALANHRNVIRDALADYSRRFREAEIEIVRTVLRRYEVDTEQWPAEVVAFVMASTSRTMALECAFDMTVAHEETLSFVREHLERLGKLPPEMPA
ncbi:putative transcriptional regulator [Nocardia nova SH22a]|uniref:Putative transcriptional regulator n=1 Tax=Nocardia nova SH22a TaxID=1415166 RepID=W5TKK0_9NOCA|nr:TetR/AcrR family transcriptional regulator [Nocardia nova]AHH17766.1 putative transcriptional regulator [Nocardia nova SH22a]